MNYFHNIKSNNLKLSFITSNIHTCLLNALRRSLLCDVKTQAFNDIKIIKNTSVLHNEFISHRISLLPLPYIKETIYISLDIKNNNDEILNVTSSDLKSNINIIPNILIIKLKKGEHLKLEANSSINSGKIHAKYQPISASYFNIIKIVSFNDLNIKNNMSSNNFNKFFNICHKNLNLQKPLFINDDPKIIGIFNKIDYSKNLNKELISNLNIITNNNYDLADNNIFIIKDFYYNQNLVYNFYIESMIDKPNILFLQSINILISNLNNLRNSNIIYNDNPHIKNSYIFKLNNQTHTIGTILEYQIRKNKNVKLAYYKLNHPLDNFILFYIIFNDIQSEYNIINYFKNAIDELISFYQKLQIEWNNINF